MSQSTFEPNGNRGFAIAALLDLPPEQAAIARWMMRQKEVSPLDVATQFGMDLNTAQDLLEELTHQNFIQRQWADGELRYVLQGMHTRTGLSEARTELFEALEHHSGGRPLAIITNPSGDVAIAAGEVFELRVTVSNQGNQGAVIEVYIDETSQPMQQWCQSPFERLALGTGQSSEVIFRFQVPIQAMPGSYPFLLMIDAPDHYPEDTPIRHQARLQVLPPIQSAVRVNDPTFGILPATSAEKPVPLIPAQPLEFRARVHNRSDRVDRFRLTCTDLPEDWYTLSYPEGPLGLGLVTAEDGLDLNPGAEGEILLRLLLPPHLTAGRLSPTLRLASANNPDLVLLEVLYLQILPQYALDVDLRTIVGRVQRMAGIYELRIANPGNATRELELVPRGDREDDLCTYTLTSERLQIAPRETAKVELQVKPHRRWKRPWFGTGMPIAFAIDLKDPFQHPLPKDSVEGTLLWEARPWWQFWLVVLAGLGIVGTILFALWWVFLRPLAPPKILTLDSDSPIYREETNDFIRLNWEIQNPRVIQQLKVVGRSPTNQILSQPVLYDFSRGLPPELKDSCTLERTLICRSVRTDARKPGEYVFEVSVVPRRRGMMPTSMQTGTILIQPTPEPKIVEFVGAVPPFNSSSLPTSLIEKSLTFQWQIRNPDQIRELRLVGRTAQGAALGKPLRLDFSQGIPESLKQTCYTMDRALFCRNFAVPVRAPGSYLFELEVVPKKGDGSVVSTQKTDTLVIQAPPAPQVGRFTATAPITPGEPIRLNWQIANPGQIQELQLVGRSPEGSLQVPLTRFSFSNGIPAELRNACQSNGTQLSCQNVATPELPPGRYVFDLVAVPKTPQGQPPQASQTPIVEVAAAPQVPLRIVRFQVNGRNVSPRHTVRFNSAQRPPQLTLSWKVDAPPDSTIELFPSPGTVPNDASLTLPVSSQSGQETITLQVTDPTGRQVRRSLIIETIVNPKE